MTSELEADQQYWFNTRTGEVEKGMVSPSIDRVGPFATHAEAERAMETVHENSRRWAEEDED